LNPGDNKIIISEIKVEEKENEETGELVIVWNWLCQINC
jgi:hypothetical protein